MPATSRYQINYEVDSTQYPVDTLLLGYKINRIPNIALTQADAIVNPLPNNPYTFDTNTLLPGTLFYSHEVYDFVVESECLNGTTQFGDRFYVFNPICTPFTLSSTAPNTVTVDWTCFIDPTNTNPSFTSLKEYIIEYRDTAGPSPWTSVTVSSTTILSYIGFPNYSQTIGIGIIGGNTYEFKLTTVLTYNIQGISGPVPTDIVIDVCPTDTIVAI